MRALQLALLLAYPLLSLSAVIVDPESPVSATNNNTVGRVCREIQRQVSPGTQVFYPGSASYLLDNHHFAATSSQPSVCSVEPNTANDVATILRIVGSTRTPFGVKCGGHAFGLGFSSTTGVQISMNRLNAIKYNSTTKFATIGGGAIWDDVYAKLLPHGVIVPGGRVDGIGVAGFVLGGGYSWKTNQLGLAMDLIVEYELVKPNGQIVVVTSSSDPDLFFALKGGFNNFGIVTNFKFKTVPQGLVWGGISTYTGEQNITAIQNATNRFLKTVTDPKAEMDIVYGYSAGEENASLFIFYDAPAPPAGLFDEMMAIPTQTRDMGKRDFLSLIKSPKSEAGAGSRVVYQTMSTTSYTEEFISAVREEIRQWESKLGNRSITVAYAVEPFLPTIFNNRTPTAYPPPNAKGVCPLNAQLVYQSEEYDAELQAGLDESVNRLRALASQQGLLGGREADADVMYPNYANKDTRVEDLYGENLDRLRKIRKRVDPNNVMYLTGGFKF